MTTTQVVETSVTVNNNSPILDYVHPDDQTQATAEATFEMTPGFKPFTALYTVYRSSNASPLQETFLTLFFFRDNFDNEVFL